MIKRFSVSLDEKLLADFDDFIKQRKYGTRSEAVRDLIRRGLVKDEWVADKEVVGVISLVFNHHQPQLQKKVTELQHIFHHQITSTTHVHMDHSNCLEVIIVRGKAAEVKKLAAQLAALRGIKDGHLAMTSTGGHLH